MASRTPDGFDGGKPEKISLKMSPEDHSDVDRDAKGFLPLEIIAERGKRALDVIESTDVREMAAIRITKMGLVPNTPPEGRFTEIPEDITPGDLFVSGTMLAPIPVCAADGINWQRMEIGFSFYRNSRMGRPKVIFSLFPSERTSNFLRPINERVAERQRGFEVIMRGVFNRKIPTETFFGLKEKIEPIYERWVREKVQEMIDRGEYSGIVSAVEGEKGLFAGSDLKIDSVLKDVDASLKETLRGPTGGIEVPSYQSWAGTEAQEGWLRLCRLPSYADDYMKKEKAFLDANSDRIIEAAGDPDHILLFGIGNFEKEAELLKKFLNRQNEKDLTVHGIDVGTEFHLCAFKAMADIRKEMAKPVKYRGHIALFACAPAISDYINKTSPEKDPTVLRICLGNTFGNFSKDENPWDNLAGNMKKGDRLLISADTVQRGPSEEERKAKIDWILSRYQSREWREWAMNPLYRAFGKDHRWLLSSDNLTISWDETIHGVVFRYRFPEAVDNRQGMCFSKDEEIELHRSRKIDPDRFVREAGRNGFTIREQILNEAGDFGYYILEKL
jgi:hypothetical protein